MGELDFKKIKEIFSENGIEFAGIFGSRARGDNSPDSDYDILIRFKKGREPGFFRYLEIEEKLSEILKQKVDLVTEEGLSPYIRDYIIEDLKVIYR